MRFALLYQNASQKLFTESVKRAGETTWSVESTCLTSLSLDLDNSWKKLGAVVHTSDAEMGSGVGRSLETHRTASLYGSVPGQGETLSQTKGERRCPEVVL